MSVQRNYERYLKSQAGTLRPRGVRGQFARHIIKKDIRSGPSGRIQPVELHATKGWRHVPAWS